MNIPHLMGPSGALPYAVGFVAQKRQSQAEYRGFQLETSGFHSSGFHPGTGFHLVAGFHARAWRFHDLPAPTLRARPSLNGAL